MRARVLTLLISTLIVAACGGSTFTVPTDDDASASDAAIPGDALVGQECARDVDCGAGICEFRIADACLRPGHCIPKPALGPTCNLYSPACTCDGETINIACTDYPDGYAGRAIAHSGACVDASVIDSSAIDSSVKDSSVGVSDGSTGDGNVSKDAGGKGDGSVTSDGAVGGIACGSVTCTTGEVCVVTVTSGGACLAPLDGGLCPAGLVLSGNCCTSVSKTYVCQPAPNCSATQFSCMCASSLCGVPCFCNGTVSNTEVDCQCDGG